MASRTSGCLTSPTTRPSSTTSPGSSRGSCGSSWTGCSTTSLPPSGVSTPRRTPGPTLGYMVESGGRGCEHRANVWWGLGAVEMITGLTLGSMVESDAISWQTSGLAPQLLGGVWGHGCNHRTNPWWGLEAMDGTTGLTPSSMVGSWGCGCDYLPTGGLQG